MSIPRFSKAGSGILIFIAVLALAQAACEFSFGSTPSDSTTTQQQTSNQPQPSNTPRPTATDEPFVGGECDAATQRIEMDASDVFHVNLGSYPETCEVYCLWVPDGGRLEIGISGFNVDLDMYVDTDLTVLSYSDHGMWESNDFGNVDEQVSISNPDGRYYIQVCSYEGLASDFTLWSEFQP